MLLALTPSCSGERDKEYRDADKTPAGYHVVFHDAGLLGSGRATYVDVLAAFDAAMIRAAIDLETRFGINRNRTLAMPFEDKIYFVLVDHIAFEVDGGLATGSVKKDRISLAMHPQRDAVPTPAGVLPWTYATNSVGVMKCGILDLPNSFPALSHEIGHRYFGPDFEH